MISRRRMLSECSIGFGALAATGLLSGQAAAATGARSTSRQVTTTHHRARAKNVIFCFMSGGVSHIDSFDPKPRLNRDHGQPMPVKVERTQFNNNGNIMGSPFEFRPAGECGMPVSNMFPYLAGVADELAVIRSMTTPVNEHAQGNFFMHSGFRSWVIPVPEHGSTMTGYGERESAGLRCAAKWQCGPSARRRQSL